MRLAPPPESCKIYTPSDLAGAIVQALGDRPQACWLEPSHGTGRFVEAIAQLGASRKRIVAIDLDRASSSADSLAITFRGVDFLRWAKSTDYRFDRIVGNPPFIAINRLPQRLQESAASVLDFNHCPIGRGANVWYAFVLASLRLLKEGGHLAFILPCAALFADYSAAIRKTMGETFSSLELYRCKRPLFENVQEGTLVAIARGYKAPPCRVRRKHFESREHLIRGLSESGIRSGHKCPAGESSSVVSTVALKEVADIQLGGVTGDAAYFLMNEERRRALNLPKSAFVPVVSKAKHLQCHSFPVKEWNKLRSSEQRVWLFSPPDRLTKHPTVKAYLKLPDNEGGCNRKAYKVTIRKPWYRTPMPKVPHAFLSGMSQFGPWLCINEMPGLNATNTLYVVTFKTDKHADWYMWALAMLSSIAQRQVRRIGRRYADGLVKYEPGPLAKIKLPIMEQGHDYKSYYIRAVKAVLSGNQKKAKEIADRLILERDKERNGQDNS